MAKQASPLRAFLCGLCMGTADLIPGISGGTVALILGIYEDLILSLRSFDASFFGPLIKGRFNEAFSHISWKFLFPVILGIGLAIGSLVHVIHAILQQPLLRPLLYALFFGLVLASVHLVGKRVKKWNIAYTLTLLGFALGTFLLVGLQTSQTQVSVPLDDKYYFSPWMFACGVAGISAMLLPGISGGYVLNILGVYSTIIASLSSFISGLTHLVFQWSDFYLLFSFGCGVLVGAVIFSRVINWALQHYHDFTLTALIGVMLGALRTVWPYYSYTTEVYLDRTSSVELSRLVPLNPQLPDLSLWITWISFLFCMIGVAIVLGAEKSATKDT